MEAAGVGQLVVGLLRERVRGGAVVLVHFTGGEKRTETWDGDRLRVALGKGFLVSRLQSLLGNGRLHLSRTPEAAALTDELLTYELRVDSKGPARAGAFRTGTRDDLVTAVRLAVQ